MEPTFKSPCGRVRLYNGDSIRILETLDSESVNCCVTSPPYWGLRDYGAEGQIGLEETPEAYVAKLVDVFREVRRVLCDDGTLWLNLGDSYAGSGKGWGGGSISESSGQNRAMGGDGYQAGVNSGVVPFGLKPRGRHNWSRCATA